MENVSSRYVENCRILSPHLENGETNLGDLWNCRSSQAVGHNLFKVNVIPSQHLRATPIRNCEYTLTHVKNDLDTAKSLKIEGLLSLDILTNIVKLEGNLKFQEDSSDKSHKEEISCRYINENYQIHIIPPIDSLINEHVSQLISSGEIEATHVVGGIIIGSSVTALIEISQNESRKDRDISGGGRFGNVVSGNEKDNEGNKQISEKDNEGNKKISEKDNEGNKKINEKDNEGNKKIADESKSQSDTSKETDNQKTGDKSVIKKTEESKSKFGWLSKLMGKVSAEVKAEWSKKEKSENYDIKVNCKARPMPSDLAPPSSVTQLFELIEKMPTAMTTESHFDINNCGIRGVPIQFMLYPIAHFARLDKGLTKMYKSLEDDIMNKFQVMLSKAIEIQQKDYVNKLMLMRDKELAFLLNKKSVLSDKIREFEATLKQIGVGFVNRSRKQLGEYKYGKCGPEEFNTIIQDFDASDAGLIDKTIQELVDEGANEVSKVKGTDESYVKKFTNYQDKQTWKEEESNPKIILEIGPQCSKTTITSYNQLITPLGEIGVKMALVMPSIAKELKLSLIIDNKEEMFKDSEVGEAIEILCANFRIGNQARAEYFAVVAAINGTEFPMRKNSTDFGRKLQAMLSLTEAYKHFKFADSVDEVKHLIRQLPDDHVAFCVPIDAPETALDFLQTWKDDKMKDIIWLIYYSKCDGEQEAPLLFVMSKSEVLAVCLDRLDLLILEERIKESEKICDVNFNLFSTDQLTKCFYEIRVSYALRFLSRVFPKSIRRVNQFLVKTENKSEVTEFLSFVRKCLSSNELVILSSMAERVVRDFPNLISIMTKHGWNDVSKTFTENLLNKESCKEMVTEIEKWLKDDSGKAKYYVNITSTKSYFSFVHVRIFLKALGLVTSSEKQCAEALTTFLIKDFYKNIETYFPDKLIENYVQNNQIYLLLQEMSPYKYERWMCAFLKGIRTLSHLDDIDTLTRVIEDLLIRCTDIHFTKKLWANEKWLLVIRRCINLKHDKNISLLRFVLRWAKNMKIECVIPDDIKQKLKSVEIVELSSVEDVERFLEREIHERVNTPWYSTVQLTSAFQDNPSLERELIEIGAAIHWDADNKRFIAEWNDKDMRQALGKIKRTRIYSRFENSEAALLECKERLLSIDVMAYILSAVDRTCAKGLLEAFSKLSHPLPLIIPDIREKNKFIVTLPLLKNIVIRWKFNRYMQKKKSTDGKGYTETMEVLENQLFSSPFRLIVVGRIDRNPIATSIFLNRITSHFYNFLSDADDSWKSKYHSALPGTVEFTWLTRETCRSPMYDKLFLDSHYSKNGNRIFLLAYLHGSVLDFPAIVSYLEKLASCFIVFEGPDEYGTKMRKLETSLSGCHIVCTNIDVPKLQDGVETLKIMTEAMTYESSRTIPKELLHTESIYTTE